MVQDPRSHPNTLSRRQALAVAAAWCSSALAGQGEPAFRLATFTAEVTPPLGHACMGGGIAPAKEIVDPLFANGFVLLGEGKPIVLVAVDWCEIRNDAYERWRQVIAEAAGTNSERVLVSCLHQHDAPIADLEAQRLLDSHRAAGAICILDFHEKAVQRVARAVRAAVPAARPITHLGTGQARVEKVASNRRYLRPDGKPAFDRTSATRDPRVREQPEGTVDPWLKTLSFWDGDRPVLALSCYATHPMSYYGKGGVSSDFVGLARKRRQADDPQVFQIYASGCSGNVTAGKYNDGNPDNRPILADRIYQAMAAAWKATRRQPLQQLAFRTVPLRLEPRDCPGFTVEDLTSRLTSDPKPFGQCLAALGLSWRKRADAGHRIDVPILGFGPAQLVLLPAESYVEYQLLAQKLLPESFVMVLGYGECAPGYIPTEKAVEEGDTNLHDWCWVAPGAERAMTAALEVALRKPR
jgi:hypothetical protein